MSGAKSLRRLKGVSPIQVIMTSQVGQFHLGTSWYVAMTSQIGWFYLGASETSWQRPKKVRLIDVLGPNLNEIKMRRRYDVACRVGSL